MARIIDPLLLQLFEFDLVDSESWEDPIDWTDFPVESGISITDHGVIQPVKLTLSGVVTDSPLPPSIPTLQRARRAYEALIDIAKRRNLVTVVTGVRVLENMAIESVALARDPATGKAVRPVVSLREVRIVQSVTVAIPPEILNPPVEPDASSAADAGSQAPGTPDAATSAASNASLAKRALEGLEGVPLSDLLQ